MNENVENAEVVESQAGAAAGGTSEVANTEEATGPTIIKAENPSPEEMVVICESIKVNHNFNVDVKPIKFNFKKSKDKESGIETIREAVTLAIAYPSIEGIVEILQTGGKGLELLQDAVEGVINVVARDIISDNSSINAATFPTDKITWEAIANMPKAQRRGGGIPKETWEEFAQDYCEVMPEATGKKLEQITNMSKILLNKLSNVKTNEAVLQLVIESLAIYADNSPNVEEYKECVEFLLNKADTFLNITDEELLSNL